MLGRAPDGYHELRTVFQAISLHDASSACRARVRSRSSARPPACRSTVESGLAGGGGALAALRRAGAGARRGDPAAKRIPLQAGLGGGSADAAATLMALARLWQVPVRPSQLTDVAATLGADVPFFLSGGTALGLGRGDEVYPLADLPRHWIVLLVPGFGVSTADAYSWYDPSATSRGRARASRSMCPGPWPSRAAQMINDLEAPIARHHPEIDQMSPRSGAPARWPRRCPAAGRPFRPVSEAADALAAVERLSGSGWRVLLTESLGRGEYAREPSGRASAGG